MSVVEALESSLKASRSFTMPISKYGECAGICDVTQPWLSLCGYTKNEVLGREPKDFLQGELTSAAHIDQMHEYFSNSSKRFADGELRPLVVEDLVNYRKVGSERVPFKFTLTVIPQLAEGTFLSSINSPVDILAVNNT